MTDWLPAMLAERARSVPSLEAFSFEPKWDGVRALVLVRDGAVHVRSRHGTDLSSRFPELAGLGAAVGRDVLLDRELVVFDHAAAPGFDGIRNRIIRSPATAREAAVSTPATFVASTSSASTDARSSRPRTPSGVRRSRRCSFADPPGEPRP